jgi:NADPH:quinone reductase-like Zn-dependent oxidoreductase
VSKLNPTTARALLLVLGVLAAGSASRAETPTEMQAIVQAGTGGPEVMQYRTVPVLQPWAGQVLVRIYAASVNPVEWKRRAGISGVAGRAPGVEGPPVSTPATPENTSIPGSDAAGVIERVGPDVTQFKVGDAVFASISAGAPGALNGAYAQFALAAEGRVTPKPKNLTYAQASGLGTATSTGVRAVMMARVSQGERVLITGAAGGVGSAAVQAAKARGAYVIGTAAAKHDAYLKGIGIDAAVDYTSGDWPSRIKNVDVVIDTVSPANAQRAMQTMKQGGRLITIAGGSADAAACGAAGIACSALRGGGGGQEEGNAVRAEVVRLIEAGKLTVNVDATFPLQQAYEAQEENRKGGTQGKVVLIVDAANAGRM